MKSGIQSLHTILIGFKMYDEVRNGRDMPGIELKKIAGSCSKARFETAISSGFLLLPTLTMLRSRLEKISISGPLPVFNTGSLAAAWNLYSNLQVLSVRDLKSREIGPIMVTPKNNLKEIKIFDSNIQETMNVIVEGIRSLEILHVKCRR